MRLTYSHVYSYENEYNLINGNALNNLKKKKNLTIFREIIHLQGRNQRGVREGLRGPEPCPKKFVALFSKTKFFI